LVLHLAQRHPIEIRHFLVRIAQTSQIGSTRTNVQVAQQRVVAVAGLGLGHRGFRISHIAKYDRVGRASLLTSHLDYLIRNLDVIRVASLRLLTDLGSLNTLYAVSTLLNDPAHTHSDIRVLLHLERIGHALRTKRTSVEL